MIRKNDVQHIMDALMIRHWGMFFIGDSVKREFKVTNSIFDAPEMDDAVVIAIASPYMIRSSHSRPASYYGRVESFAWGYDYHIEVKKQLNQVMLRLFEVTGKHFDDVLFCVDNSPYNDREVAFHAGLGKVGFNHLLINPSFGTQFFIGYVIIKYGKGVFEKTDSTEVGQLAHPNCEKCLKCVKACPTGVCGRDEKDMTQCLSSLTQTKNFIETSYREKMITSIYGCTICQNVCPLNHHLEGNDRLKHYDSNWIDLFELLKMNQAKFKECYGHMGFSWRSLWIYKRNALIVLGNTRNREVLEKLRAFKHLEANPMLGIYYCAAINRLEEVNFEEYDTF